MNLAHGPMIISEVCSTLNFVHMWIDPFYLLGFWSTMHRSTANLSIMASRQADEATTSFVPDRPRTGSLEQFVYDVFAKEDMQSEKCFKALQA